MKKILLILAIISGYAFTTSAQTGIISTIAGNGINGDGGDGGSALTASFSFPDGVFVTTGGVIYVSDRQNNKIKKIGVDGVLTTIAGTGAIGNSGDGGMATDATLSFPGGICGDNSGNIYIADVNNNRVRMIAPSGIISTIAGNDSMGYNGDSIIATTARLFIPFDVSTDAEGNIFIADAGNNRIRMIRKEDGIILTVAGGPTKGYCGDNALATKACLNFPTGVTSDAAGNLYIADYSNSRIRKVNHAGIITSIAGNGTEGYSGDGGPATAASLHNPLDIITDNKGNIYFIDETNNVVREINNAGVISLVAGDGIYDFTGDGGPAINAAFRYPGAITTDGAGSIYIADEQNFRIRKISYPSLYTPQAKAKDREINIFPNPAAQNIIVRSPKDTDHGQIVIYDETGKEVNHINVTGALTGIDISELAEGNYTLSFITPATIYTGKLTKLR